MTHSVKLQNRLSHWLRALPIGVGVLALGLLAAGCNEKTSSDTTTVQDTGVNQNAEGEGGGAGGVTITGTKVAITLPADRSRFVPAAVTIADPTPCLACHGVTVEAINTADTGLAFELVNEECRGCHSADYVSSQPKINSAGWAKVVKKMADKFDTTVVNGVPTVDVMLNPAHQTAMTAYLTTAYGKP